MGCLDRLSGSSLKSNFLFWRKKPSTSFENITSVQASNEQTDALKLPASFDNNPVRPDEPKFDLQLTAKELWGTAYEQLRSENSTSKLVSEYESLLASEFAQIISSDDEPGSNGIASKLESLDGPTRKRLMGRLARKRLNEIDSSSSEKAQEVLIESAKIMQKVQSTVGGALSGCPPASIAWTVSCLLVIPVSVSQKPWLDYHTDATKITEYLEQLSASQDGLKYVVSRLPWYTQVVDLNADSWSDCDNFNQRRGVIYDQLIQLYQLLIEYQIRCFVVSKNLTSRVLRNATGQEDWAGRINKIQETEKLVKESLDRNDSTVMKQSLEGIWRSSEAHYGEMLQMSRELREQSHALHEMRDTD
ncbi:uncharacterized protein KD926_003030 [Aspergillus affinis]|uniref:uncharacterized protein n=1 Tax=Aspergillus affinis TaxID=1070780 RepID=UPI0022FE0694|nr:uncharacterized protein KD926_003030 [Aspergillus affinis]KAI9043680.1 hypothetical protein KD926_003030 [Aspergillus affinis]